MIQLVYLSTAVEFFTDEDLVALLRKSRDNNSKAGITGLLLYRGGNFIQALEGDERAVLDLQERISRDPRHKDFTVLLQQPVRERHFPAWSMGFQDVNAHLAKGESGASAFLERSRVDDAFAGKVEAVSYLLGVFRESVR